MESRAQIYVKSNDNLTSVLVSEKDFVYYSDVIDAPEISGIQRGVSFIKHNLRVDVTEIYPDKEDINKVLKDAYINWCKINQVEGKNPNDKMLERCVSNLHKEERWNFIHGDLKNVGRI